MDKSKIDFSDRDQALFFANAIIDSHTDMDEINGMGFHCVHCAVIMSGIDDEKTIHKDDCPVVIARDFVVKLSKEIEGCYE